MRRYRAVFAGLVLLPACVHAQASGEPKQLYKNDRTTTLIHPIGFAFPPKVHTFERVKVHNYDAQGLNVSYGYSDNRLRIKATVYVYPKAKGGPGASLAAHAEELWQDILGSHPGAKPSKLKSGKPSLSGARRNGYMGVYGVTERLWDKVEPVASVLMVFEHEGYFLKFRFTYPHATGRESAAAARGFMESIPWPE